MGNNVGGYSGGGYNPSAGSTGQGQYMGAPDFSETNFNDYRPPAPVPNPGGNTSYPSTGIQGVATMQPDGSMAPQGPYVPGNQRNPDYQASVAAQAASHAQIA